jgi:hypothetical protein
VPCIAATSGLLYQPQMIGEGDCGAIGGMKIGRGNRSTRRNLPEHHFVHHKSHLTRPGRSNLGRRDGKPASNNLSYGATLFSI